VKPTVPEALAMIVAGLDALDEVSPADLPPEQALTVTQVLLVQHDRLQGAALRAVADVDRRELHNVDGSPSAQLWVAEQATSFGRTHVALARKLDRFPQVADRIAAGGLAVDDGALIGTALDRVRRLVDQPDGLIDGQPAEQALFGVIVNGVCSLAGQSRGGLPDSDPRLLALRTELIELWQAPLAELTRLEAAFLRLAREVDRVHLKPALTQLTDALRPNELDQQATDDQANRGLVLRKDTDRPGWDLRGHLDDETGELLHTALTAAAATDPDNPVDTDAAAALRAQGLDPQVDGCVQVRSKPQRMHDALTLLLHRTLASKALGLRGKAPVCVNVTVSAEALAGVPGALPATGSAGQTLPISLARRLACDNALTRFVLSLGHKVLETSHTSRTLKPHERKIKQLETSGVCETAGCGRGDPTGHPLIPHHITPYAQCKTTSLEDTILLCDISHAHLHHGNTLRLKNGRRINEHGYTD
jgi:hypothetical protein